MKLMCEVFEMIYAIYEENMERLRKKLKRIENKCGKYGCEFSFKEVGEEFRTHTNEDGSKVDLRYVLVEAEGTAKVNGWKFAGTLEHGEKGNIIRGVEGVEIPERYYHCDAYCEHCKTKRTRKDSFIVFNEESGEFKQVGSRCLNDFTGGLSATAVAEYISWFDELIQGEVFEGSGRGERWYNRENVAYIAAETIRCFGYRRSDEDNSTKSRVVEIYLYLNGYFDGECRAKIRAELEANGFEENNAESKELACKVTEWAINLEEKTNYDHNLKVVFSSEYIKFFSFGLLVSAFPAFNRELERQAEERIRAQKLAEEVAESAHVGKVGERIKFEISSKEVITSWWTEFGLVKVYKFVDAGGNVFTWKTTSYVEDAAKNVTGTVKEHKEYRGVKQTELTRCRLS